LQNEEPNRTIPWTDENGWVTFFCAAPSTEIHNQLDIEPLEQSTQASKTHQKPILHLQVDLQSTRTTERRPAAADQRSGRGRGDSETREGQPARGQGALARGRRRLREGERIWHPRRPPLPPRRGEDKTPSPAAVASKKGRGQGALARTHLRAPQCGDKEGGAVELDC
jgi:hypothetical protein